MNDSPTTRWLDRTKSPLLWMVLAALAARVALVLYFRYYDFSGENGFFSLLPFVPKAVKDFPFGFGYETGAVAYSLATGHGFSSPFVGATGPTAWLAPVYPSLCALVFKIFGCFTAASGFVILFINSLFSALTCVPIVRIAERMGQRKVGLLAGWLWAGGIFFMRWPTTWVWDMSLSALLLAILFLQSLRLVSDSGWKAWARFGLAWGVAALTNPALLAFLPAAGLYPAWRLWRNGHSWLRPAAVAALVFTACIGPWMIRNRVVFGEWIFIRGNAPFEFSLGNYHGSNAMGWFGKHPTQNKFEYAKFQRMGELAYVAEKKRASITFVKKYPGEFLDLCAMRVAAFWTGSALTTEPWFRRWFFAPFSAFALLGLIAALAYGIEGAWLCFWLMLSYPVTYYLIFAQPRYRHAIEPEMLLLGTYFVYQAMRDLSARFSAGRRAAAAAVASGIQPELSAR